MTITINLSEADIRRAITELRQAQEHIRWGVQDTVEALARDGAEIANQAYGGMANAIDYGVDETSAVIASVGENNLIAEFGAGDATLEPKVFFERIPETPVYPGSYSLLEGTGEYYLSRMEWGGTGIWHWNGIPYSAIEPRQGLYKAKQHIISEAANVAREVIKL